MLLLDLQSSISNTSMEIDLRGMFTCNLTLDLELYKHDIRDLGEKWKPACGCTLGLEYVISKCYIEKKPKEKTTRETFQSVMSGLVCNGKKRMKNAWNSKWGRKGRIAHLSSQNWRRILEFHWIEWKGIVCNVNHPTCIGVWVGLPMQNKP